MKNTGSNVSNKIISSHVQFDDHLTLLYFTGKDENTYFVPYKDYHHGDRRKFGVFIASGPNIRNDGTNVELQKRLITDIRSLIEKILGLPKTENEFWDKYVTKHRDQTRLHTPKGLSPQKLMLNIKNIQKRIRESLVLGH